MTNVIVSRNRTIKVSTGGTAGIVDSITPVVLKNATNSVGRLDHLLDVDASNEVENATLVYDPNTDKYIVKKLDLADVTGSLDGGTF
jgi:fructose-specific phosphotransferase system component IIB